MILITGATGFLGSHLMRHFLKSNLKVRAIFRPASDRQQFASFSDRIEWVECDVRDPLGVMDAMDGIEEIYHCAALVTFNARLRAMQYAVNVHGTANVVNAALASGVRKLIHVSSIAAFGRAPGGGIVTENSKWSESKLNSHYSISKFHAEREVWRAMAEGLNAVIVSPSVILGKWKWSHGSGKFFSRVWKGLNFYSDGVTGFVDVSDCVSCMAALMKSEISGERFILSSENISYRELVSQIAELFGKRKPNRKAGRWLLHSAVLAEGFRSWLLNREPLINPETARFGLEKFYYSNEKICAALNYRFKPVAETIRETALSFLSENRK